MKAFWLNRRIAVALLSAWIGLLSSSPAFAAQADLARRISTNQCTIRTPEEAVRAEPHLGLTHDELFRLYDVDETNQQWVRWYLGGAEKLDAFLKTRGQPSMERIASWAPKCDDMKRFIRIANRDLFGAPKMTCMGGSLTYTYRVIGTQIELEISEASAGNAPSSRPGTTLEASRQILSREPVELTQTGNPACPVRVTQSKPDAKKLKMCLPATPRDMTGEGAVSMSLHGKPLADEDRQIACQLEREFASQAHDLIIPASDPIDVSASHASSQASSVSGSGAHVSR